MDEIRATGMIVNDVQSQLNATRVARVETPDSLDDLRRVILRVGSCGESICLAGGRHAMGGQQFATDGVLLDMTRLNRVLSLDTDRGLVEVEAGIQWPELIAQLLALQPGRPGTWSIAQKQTGANQLCLGGALSANIHGRGLRMKPLIGDVESFVLVDAGGCVRTCSRTENAELFRLAIGGYGLFGAIYSVTLRLAPRTKLQRVVEIIDVDRLIPAFEERITSGFLYGDFQYHTDEKSDDFLRKGVFACYRPLPPETPILTGQKQLTEDDWLRLVHLAHTDKRRAWELYAGHYRATSGQVYWSDTHQLSAYVNDYPRQLARQLGTAVAGTDVITELYVPRAALTDFLNDVRADFRRHNVNVIYGTIRLIETDDESFLAWATQPHACVIFNLYTLHSPEGRAHSAAAFRRLIDLARQRGGSFYLTYHKHATREQVAACYPQFTEFLRLKREYDPPERFQSDWYRHYRSLPIR